MSVVVIFAALCKRRNFITAEGTELSIGLSLIVGYNLKVMLDEQVVAFVRADQKPQHFTEGSLLDVMFNRIDGVYHVQVHGRDAIERKANVGGIQSRNSL